MVRSLAAANTANHSSAVTRVLTSNVQHDSNVCARMFKYGCIGDAATASNHAVDRVVQPRSLLAVNKVTKIRPNPGQQKRETHRFLCTVTMLALARFRPRQSKSVVWTLRTHLEPAPYPGRGNDRLIILWTNININVNVCGCLVVWCVGLPYRQRQ